MTGQQNDVLTQCLTGTLSRRTALRRLGNGGLIAAAGLAASRSFVVAQATPEASPGAAPPIIQSWFDAWNAHDTPQLVSLYTANGIYEDVPSMQSATGTDQITAFLTAFMQGAGDIMLDLHSAFLSGDWGAAEYLFSGTDQGFIPGGEGKSFSVRTVTIFQLSADKIAHSSDYYDLYTVLTQLGLTPPPGTPTSGTPAA
jgi:steroid delta-isomerase-like uncharacterized protein